MPDIGFGEILVIVVIALLVFGPDRLPKVAADAARTLRQVRRMAAEARQNLVEASGLDGDEDVSQAVRDLRELDPRRAMQGLSGEVVGSSGRSGNGSAGNGSASRSGSVGIGSASRSGTAAAGGSAAGGSAASGSAGSGGAGNGRGPGLGAVAPDGPAVAGSDGRSGTAAAPDTAATSRPDLPGSVSQRPGQPGRGSAQPVRAADQPVAPPVIDAAPVDPDWT